MEEKKKEKEEGRSPGFERCAALETKFKRREMTPALLCAYWLKTSKPPSDLLLLSLSSTLTHTLLPLTYRHTTYFVHPLDLFLFFRKISRSHLNLGI